ncbi:MAG TPA: MBL fold metallo-hydrolase [Cyclobacteriaceae bacterium]|nr:MBL fold metallo-hydrolase [Cyclobacteriaceae bacterium]
MIFLLLFPVAFLLIFFGVGFLLSGPKYQGPVSDHFDGKKFFTPGGRPAHGLSGVLKWMRTRKNNPWTPQMNLTHGAKPPERVGRGARITFVNHSSFLIQVDGINILTDPVWSERVSPFSWAGPKRMRPPGIRLEDLPKIDIILLTHNHYDHLDLPTLTRIYNQHQPKVVTSLGIKPFLDSRNIHNSTEMDWWQTFTFNESISIESVPAQHFSSRGMFDRDATLWCGFVLRRPGGNIYFVGDTGYHSTMFKEIGVRCAPIDIAIIPIGAYKPEWFMSPIHVSPSEAVMIHKDINSRFSIATHFGTFPLADDSLEDPVFGLQQALRENEIALDEFVVPKEGEGIII